MDEAATRLDMSRTSLFRVESGEYRANVHLVRSMMDLYDCYVERLLDQVRETLKPRWYHQYRSNSPNIPNQGYIELEDEAAQVREFSALTVPGLLQTEPYIRALFEAYPLPRTPKHLEDDVAVRLMRKRRLIDKDEPLELVAIVDEAALRRTVGGTEVMRCQLEHLAEAAALPTVTLQVLPLRIGAHGAMDGGFTLLSFHDNYNPELLFVSYGIGSLHLENADQLRMARLMFDQLRTGALSPADSLTVIKEELARLDDH